MAMTDLAFCEECPDIMYSPKDSFSVRLAHQHVPQSIDQTVAVAQDPRVSLWKIQDWETSAAVPMGKHVPDHLRTAKTDILLAPIILVEVAVYRVMLVSILDASKPTPPQFRLHRDLPQPLSQATRR